MYVNVIVWDSASSTLHPHSLMGVQSWTDPLVTASLGARYVRCIQGGPKSKLLPNDQKIVLKTVNEIRFSRQIKVWIKHNNIRWN